MNMMSRNVNQLFRTLVTVAVLMSIPIGVVTQHQDPAEGSLTDAQVFIPETSHMRAPVLEVPTVLETPPSLTPEELERVRRATQRSHRPGPTFKGRSVSEPLPEGAVVIFKTAAPGANRSAEQVSPESMAIFRNTEFQSVVPKDDRSLVMESSMDELGKNVFFTGNWFAARSTDGGKTFVYVDPFAGWTEPSKFCCDQLVLADEARNMLLWLRQGATYTDPKTENFENEIKLGVSIDGGVKFRTYTFKPTDIKSGWTNQWLDYPEMQIGAKFLYLSFNLFDAKDNATRSLMLRLPLDTLKAGDPLTYQHYSSEKWFTFEPVAGADHIMYWAANSGDGEVEDEHGANGTSTEQERRVGIWKWDEISNKISFVARKVPPWSSTTKGDAVCGSKVGNWTGRLDDRITAGARYRIHATDIQYPGRMVLGWWWTVKQGGSFPLPYIEGVAFFEDTLTQIPGSAGRPTLADGTSCFAYPAAAVNRRGDLALVFNYSSGAEDGHKPNVGFAVADEYVQAPPAWITYLVQASRSRPQSNEWGDYNTVRSFSPSGDVWGGAAHFLPTAERNDPAPVYFVFGRERDRRSWTGWNNK